MRTNLPQQVLPDEITELLLDWRDLRIECIVSTGQVTPEGDWYDQDWDEWVLLLEGAARLRIEDEAEDRSLAAGDWLYLPAHCRHRVTWTQSEPPAVWLAIHFPPEN